MATYVSSNWSSEHVVPKETLMYVEGEGLARPNANSAPFASESEARDGDDTAWRRSVALRIIRSTHTARSLYAVYPKYWTR